MKTHTRLMLVRIYPFGLKDALQYAKQGEEAVLRNLKWRIDPVVLGGGATFRFKNLYPSLGNPALGTVTLSLQSPYLYEDGGRPGAKVEIRLGPGEESKPLHVVPDARLPGSCGDEGTVLYDASMNGLSIPGPNGAAKKARAKGTSNDADEDDENEDDENEDAKEVVASRPVIIIKKGTGSAFLNFLVVILGILGSLLVGGLLGRSLRERR